MEKFALFLTLNKFFSYFGSEAIVSQYDNQWHWQWITIFVALSIIHSYYLLHMPIHIHPIKTNTNNTKKATSVRERFVGIPLETSSYFTSSIVGNITKWNLEWEKCTNSEIRKLDSLPFPFVLWHDLQFGCTIFLCFNFSNKLWSRSAVY